MSKEEFKPRLNLPSDKMVFTLKGKELETANEWIIEQLRKTDNKTGSAGDRFEYRFNRTGLGIFVSVYDHLTKEEKNCTDW